MKNSYFPTREEEEIRTPVPSGAAVVTSPVPKNDRYTSYQRLEAARVIINGDLSSSKELKFCSSCQVSLGEELEGALLEGARIYEAYRQFSLHKAGDRHGKAKDSFFLTELNQELESLSLQKANIKNALMQLEYELSLKRCEVDAGLQRDTALMYECQLLQEKVDTYMEVVDVGSREYNYLTSLHFRSGSIPENILAPLYEDIFIEDDLVAFMNGRRLSFVAQPSYNLKSCEINVAWSYLCTMLLSLRALHGFSDIIDLNGFYSAKYRESFLLENSSGASPSSTSTSTADRTADRKVAEGRQSPCSHASITKKGPTSRFYVRVRPLQDRALLYLVKYEEMISSAVPSVAGSRHGGVITEEEVLFLETGVLNTPLSSIPTARRHDDDDDRNQQLLYGTSISYRRAVYCIAAAVAVTLLELLSTPEAIAAKQTAATDPVDPADTFTGVMLDMLNALLAGLPVGFECGENATATTSPNQAVVSPEQLSLLVVDLARTLRVCCTLKPTAFM